ncbi:MAG: hypothetical protein LBV04_10115, partial [Deferribacteraceae bacterium]|nr:hypothetical protein [Deferribacteraceae bacterium]
MGFSDIDFYADFRELYKNYSDDKLEQPEYVAKIEESLKKDTLLRAESYLFVGRLLARSAVAIQYVKEILENRRMLATNYSNVIDVAYQQVMMGNGGLRGIFSNFTDREQLDAVLNQLDNESLIRRLSVNSPMAHDWDYVMTALARRNPEFYKKELLDVDTDAENRAYMAFCLPADFDDDFIIELLSDKSKKVANVAFNILKAKPELQAKIAPLVDSKKKAIREYAEKLLMAY